jgi:NTP pyrophosphatase (non-canonical NTP hydrolase)
MGMDLNDFQKAAAEHITAHEGVLQCFTLGLGEESGEVVKEVTKLWRYAQKTDPKDLSDEEKDHICEEMGDVLWYLAMISQLLGRSVADLPKYNLDKLHYRRTIKEYQKWFEATFPDADADFTSLYWEKVRKVQRHKPHAEGAVLHGVFPDYPEFCSTLEFPGIWVSPVDKRILEFMLTQAMGPVQRYWDYLLSFPRNLKAASELERES